MINVCSCKVIEQQQQQNIYKVKTDSVYIYEKDSIYIENNKDTVFVSKYKYLTKERLKTDTIIVTDYKTITKEVKVKPKFLVVCTILFWLLILIAVLFVLVRFLYLKK